MKAGVERIFSDKMNYLANTPEYEVTFITYEQGDHPFAYALDKRIRHLDLDARFFTLGRYGLLRRIHEYFLLKRKVARELTRILAWIKPDIVITTTYTFDVIDVVMRQPYCNILEAHVCFDHTNLSFEKKGLLDAALAKLKHHYYLKKFNKARVLVALTEADRLKWSRKFSNEVITITNAITQYPKTVRPYHEREKIVLCAGRLDRQKGFDMMIDAWRKIYAKHPDWKVNVFGEGPERAALERQIKEKIGNGSFMLCGNTSGIYEEYQRSSVFAFSSRYEGFGLVLAEAMSCGLPCVSFDCPCGPAEILNDKVDGLLVPEGDVDAFAEQLDWLISHEEARWAMGRAARESARKYSLDIIMPQWTALFDRLCPTATTVPSSSL